MYHADCRDVLPLLEKVDLVLTDPPFSESTHYNAKSNRDKGYGNKSIDFAAIDFAAIDALMVGCGRICDGWFISFMDWQHIARLEAETPPPWEFMRFGVWVKSNPMPQISADRPANGWTGIAYLRHNTKPKWYGGGHHGNWFGRVITDGRHPTGKPLPFVTQLVERFTVKAGTVLDPFAGSGTTGRACKDLGRKCIMIEIEGKYCEIVAGRLEQEVLF